MARQQPQLKKWQIVAAAAVLAVLAAIIAVGAVLEGTGEEDGPGASSSDSALESGTATSTSVPAVSEPMASDTAAPTATGGSAPQVLTVAGSPDLAALLAAGENDSATFKTFSANHRGATIQFDGYIANIAKHGSYSTRFDFLIYAGDSGGDLAGPDFQFSDVNVPDLGLTGAGIPDPLTVGMNLRIVAKVGTYNETSNLFLLDPVSAEVR